MLTSSLSARLREVVNRSREQNDSHSVSFIGPEVDKKMDQEMTISFPIPPCIDKQTLAKVRSEVLDNDKVINKLRSKLDHESDQTREIRKLILSLNTVMQDSSQQFREMRSGLNKAGSLNRILTKHQELLREQLSVVSAMREVPQTVKNLNTRIATLNKQIRLAKSASPVKHQKSDDAEELSRLKGKCRFYQKQHHDLTEFIQFEIDIERQQNEETIADLEARISRLTDDIESSKSQLAEKRASTQSAYMKSLLARISAAKADLQHKSSAIIALKEEQARLETELQLRTERVQLMEKELDAYAHLH